MDRSTMNSDLKATELLWWHIPREEGLHSTSENMGFKSTNDVKFCLKSNLRSV